MDSRVSEQKAKNGLRVFTRKVAVELRKQGFNIIKTEVNYRKPQFDVYVFENTKELQDALTHLSSSWNK